MDSLQFFTLPVYVECRSVCVDQYVNVVTCVLTMFPPSGMDGPGFSGMNRLGGGEVVFALV